MCAKLSVGTKEKHSFFGHSIGPDKRLMPSKAAGIWGWSAILFAMIPAWLAVEQFHFMLAVCWFIWATLFLTVGRSIFNRIGHEYAVEPKYESLKKMQSKESLFDSENDLEKNLISNPFVELK